MSEPYKKERGLKCIVRDKTNSNPYTKMTIEHVILMRRQTDNGGRQGQKQDSQKTIDFNRESMPKLMTRADRMGKGKRDSPMRREIGHSESNSRKQLNGDI